MTLSLIDPLAEIVALLAPKAGYFKSVESAGCWRVAGSEQGRPYYCVVLQGGARLQVKGHAPLLLQTGDFFLVPETYDFAMTSLTPPADSTHKDMPVQIRPGEFRLGDMSIPVENHMLVGHCWFGSPDAALLVSLLPRVIHLRHDERLIALVKLVGDEARQRRPAREMILQRLLEVMLIEALRLCDGTDATPGLMRGLSDPRLAAALRKIHETPGHNWTIAAMAQEASLSRSAFFERFSKAVGLAPMEYLLAWRMALAKKMLRQEDTTIGDIAERVGYSGASTFSVAFARYTGMPPRKFALMTPDLDAEEGVLEPMPTA